MTEKPVIRNKIVACDGGFTLAGDDVNIRYRWQRVDGNPVTRADISKAANIIAENNGSEPDDFTARTGLTRAVWETKDELIASMRVDGIPYVDE